MNTMRWTMCASLGLSWISAVWADYPPPRLSHSFSDNDVEMYDTSDSAADMLLWSIPTTIGAIGTYSVIMGSRSSVVFARALEAIARADEHAKTVSGSLRAVVQTALKQLKPHEIIALVTTFGATLVNASNTASNLVESIVHGMRAYRAEGSARKKHFHNMMVTLNMARNNAVLGAISAASLWLLLDYARDGIIHSATRNT